MSGISLPAFILGFAFVLRLMTLRLASSSLNVDRWFWKAYVKAVRREGRFPPHLPQYLLDEEQWYPPLFPWLLVRIPETVFRRVEPWLAIGLDLLRLGLLLVATDRFAGADSSALTTAGIVYATAPILLIYNVQLNPRALGALFLDVGIVLVLMTYAPGGSAWFWLPATLLGGLVLLTHKMTTQLLVFLCLAGALLARDARLLLMIPAAAAAAFALSGGFYRKVFRAHLDIVSFWQRNWRWLQADPIRESPIYGESGYETPGRFHRTGIVGVLRHLKSLLRLLPGGWVFLALFAGGAFVFPWSGAPEGWLRGWVCVILVFALATTFVPLLKSLGAGSLYLYNAAFPLALAWAWALQAEPTSGWTPWGAAASLVASMGVIVATWIGFEHRRSRADEGWDEVVDFLTAASRGVVFCLPQQRFDEIAYRTGQRVAYGGHGFGLRKLEPLFPRLMVSVAELQQRYGVRYFVARDDTLTESLAKDLPSNPVRLGRYRVYTLGSDESSSVAS